MRSRMDAQQASTVIGDKGLDSTLSNYGAANDVPYTHNDSYKVVSPMIGQVRSAIMRNMHNKTTYNLWQLVIAQCMTYGLRNH